MNEKEFITRIQTDAIEKIEAHLRERPIEELASLDMMEALGRGVLSSMGRVFFEVWMKVLEQVAKSVALCCPKCGRPRKCKRRPGEQMKFQVLGIDLEMPKLYLECDHCDAPGVSITKLLTGLSSGDASVELKLCAGYSAAEHSYREASRDLEAHHGQEVERTKVRRMALEVEEWAKEFAEEKRHTALEQLEGKVEGVDRLIIQSDGGSVRTGKLAPCEPGDEGYGKKTPKTNRPVRKRVTQKREIITIDVREPGQEVPSGLDVVVPIVAEEGEREYRMLATAARSGLKDDTEVYGLGDLGSNLPKSFDLAFAEYESVYSADWKHVRNYVEGAMDVLEGLDVEDWGQKMRDAIWDRDARKCEELFLEAYDHRVEDSSEDGKRRCPLHALVTYVCNNWDRMNAALFKGLGLDFVSARAESQVRDRTKGRFSVPGAWCLDNLEGKACLRAIIAEGSWGEFRLWCLERLRSQFRQELLERLQGALRVRRLSPSQVADLLDDTDVREDCSAAA